MSYMSNAAGEERTDTRKTRPEQKAQHCAAACAALMSMWLTLRCCCDVAALLLVEAPVLLLIYALAAGR
jgi:hypothetical protein